jgi:hypothetical protein
MKEQKYSFHTFLNLAAGGDMWPTSHLSCFASEEISSNTHWIGSWVDFIAGLDIGKGEKNL